MLAQYGKLVTIDATHKTTQYDKHQLVTIMVVDSDNHGICVGWMLCSSESGRTMKVFASVLRKLCGNIQMEILLTDDTNAGWNAFKEIFGSLEMHFLCNWHLKQNWRKATKGNTSASTSGKMDGCTAELKSESSSLSPFLSVSNCLSMSLSVSVSLSPLSPYLSVSLSLSPFSFSLSPYLYPYPYLYISISSS